MSELSEKRANQRIPHVARIRYCSGEEGEYRQARMFNYSNTGMYLELNYPPPKLGANLLIEVLAEGNGNMDIEEEAQEPKTCYYAKVIWKKNLHNSMTADYGVGLSYLHTPLSDN